MTQQRFLISAGCLLVLLWSLLALWSHQKPHLPVGGLLSILAAAWIVVLLTWRKLANQPQAQWTFWILGFAIAMRIPSLFAVPLYEDDYFRFLWDGWNSLTEGTPYLGPPENFFQNKQKIPAEVVTVLHQVNYPEVPTIYAPVCQLFFFLAALIKPASLFALRFVLLTVEMGALFLFSRFASTKALLLLAWCPLLIFESVFQVHPDVLGMTMLLGAYYFRLKNQNILTGIFAGLALCIKITTLPALPFLLWPLKPKSLIAMTTIILASYAPFLLQGSRADFDGLAVFSREWEFNAGLYALVITFLSDSSAKVLMLFFFSISFLSLWFTWVKKGALVDAIPQKIAIVYGLFFFISPVVNPWYLIWLVPFIALKPQAWSVAALALVSVSYVRGQTLSDRWNLSDFAQPVWLQITEYTIILILAGYSCLYKKKPA